MKFTRISHQILVAFVMVVVVTLAVTGAAIITLAKRIVIENLERGNQELVIRLAEEIDLAVEGVRPALQLLAESQALRALDPTTIEVELVRYQSHYPSILNVYVADFSGKQLARSDGGPLQDVSTNLGFQLARQGHELVSDVYIPERGTGPILTIYQPIETEGQVVGVLVADINFTRLQDVLAGLSLAGSETAVVLAANGRVVAHSNPDELLQPLAYDDPSVVEAFVNGPPGILENYVDELGREVVGVHAPVRDLDWGVVIQTPVGELASQVTALQATIWAGVLGGIALAFIVGWFMARRLTDPISRLVRITERVTDGDLFVTVGVTSSNEIGRLANSFNRMVESLQTYRRQVEKRERELLLRNRELEALNAIAEAVSHSMELDELLGYALEMTLQVTDLESGHIRLRAEEDDNLVLATQHGMAEGWEKTENCVPLGECACGLAALQEELVVIEDLDNDPRAVRRGCLDSGVQALVAVPLTARDKVLGTLHVCSHTARSFSGDELRLLTTIGQQIGVAVENARLYEQARRYAAELEQRVAERTVELKTTNEQLEREILERRRAETSLRATLDRTEILYRASRSLIALQSLPELLKDVVDIVAEALPADRVILVTVDLETRQVTQFVKGGAGADHIVQVSFEELWDGLSGWVLRERQPALSPKGDPDRRESLAVRRRRAESNSGSILVVPLSHGDELLGTMTAINCPDERDFGQQDVELMSALANLAAVAIRNARLYEETIQRAEQLAALYDVGRDLATTLELSVLLPNIAQKITKTLKADRCAIFLFNEAQGVLRTQAAYGYMADRLTDFEYRPGEEVVGLAFATGKPQYVPDLNLKPATPQRDEIRAVLAVPLVSPTRGTLGVLSVTCLQPDAFSLDQQKMLETMARQIAGAVENARLYAETRGRAKELATLYEIGKEITTFLDLDSMLQKISDDAIKLVKADKSLIFLIDAEKKRLLKAVGYGYTEEQLSSYTFMEFCSGISGWVLSEKTPTLSNDIQKDERNRGLALENARKGGDRYAAIAPLLIGEQMIGTLTVVKGEDKEPFTSADLDLVTMLAGQAAIAIRNTQLYEAAQEADQLKSAFLATMSHELRTPLNSIIGFTGVLLQGLAGPLTEEQSKQLGMVRDSARHLLDLINDVLDISKIEAGQLEVVFEPFDMRRLIGRVVRTLSPMAEKKGLKLETRVAPNVGQITSDRRRVEQILMNLVNNALKFTERGEVCITSKVINGTVMTQVIDTGIGIKAEDMNKLFLPFRQIETGLARKHEGTGLGLSICKRLVEMLGGEIKVKSEWGKGSTFTFTLPVE